MATSELGHYVRFGEAQLAAGDFCDTGLLRRAIGNIDHLADQYAQPRVKWVGHSQTSYSPDVTIETFTYHEVWRSTRFDLHVQEDGSTYRCLARIRHGSNNATHGAQFKAVLAWPGASAPELAIDDINAVATVGYSASTTLGWTTFSTLIYLDAPRVGLASGRVSVIDSVGGRERSAVHVQAQLYVFGRVQNVLATPQIGGVELSEYLPP